MQVLITGGMGFIGLHTARAFLEDGHEVVATQFRVRREPSFVRDALGDRLRRVVVDISSPYALDEIVEQHGIDQILHLAVPGVGALSPAEDYRTNMDGLLHVLETARRHRVRRVVVASSVVVYNGVRGPWPESAPLHVESPNATSAYKKAAEVLGAHYADRSGLDVVFARISYVYGPLYHSMVNAPSRLVHAAVRSAPDDGRGDPYADDWYDYCYVKDCAEGLRLLQIAPLSGRFYNVGGGRATANSELAEAVRTAIPGSAPRLAHGRRAGADGADGYLDLELMTRETGYRPQYDVRSGVAEYASWLRENEH
jgi:UDP-glucose 4-epimerase